MNVPNYEKVPFKDMTPEERIAIVEAKLLGDAELFLQGSWREADSDSVSFIIAYRTKPRQLIIPWEHIKPEYKWAAMDANGQVSVYENKPNAGVEYWKDVAWGVGCYCLNIDTTGIDWRDSLVQRPEGV